MRSFTTEEKRVIEDAQRRGEPLLCPSCAVALDSRPVPTPSHVAYVRRRLVVTCPKCHGHLAIDRD
jgi:hypothetical protein